VPFGNGSVSAASKHLCLIMMASIERDAAYGQHLKEPFLHRAPVSPGINFCSTQASARSLSWPRYPSTSTEMFSSSDWGGRPLIASAMR